MVSALVGKPAESVSTLLSPGGEGSSVRKHLSPYGAVLSDRSPEGWDSVLSLCSVCPHAHVFGYRRLEAGERTEHAHSLRFLLCARLPGRAVQDSVAACADVSEHVLHWVGRLGLISFIQPLPLTGTQRRFNSTGQNWLLFVWVSDCHQFLKGER